MFWNGYGKNVLLSYNRRLRRLWSSKLFSTTTANKQLLFLSPLLLNWLGVVLGWITFKWKWILHIEMYIYRYTYKTDKHIGTLADRLTFCLLIWLTEWLGDRLNHQFTNLTTSSSVTTTLPNHFERSLNVLPIHCLSPSGLVCSLLVCSLLPEVVYSAQE